MITRHAATHLVIALSLAWLGACATAPAAPKATTPAARPSSAPAAPQAPPRPPAAAPVTPVATTILPAAPPPAPGTAPAPSPTPPPAPPPREPPAERVMATTMAADRPGWTPIAEPSADPVHDILFDFDSALLRPDALATLQENLAWFSRHPAVPVVIEGHCDERGSHEYNLALGQRRADAAADYLIKGGLSPQRVRTISYGKELPFALGHDEAAWALNRRAHFRTPGTAAASSPDE